MAIYSVYRLFTLYISFTDGSEGEPPESADIRVQQLAACSTTVIDSWDVHIRAVKLTDEN
jgi:hypothetical protein